MVGSLHGCSKVKLGGEPGKRPRLQLRQDGDSPDVGERAEPSAEMHFWMGLPGTNKEENRNRPFGTCCKVRGTNRGPLCSAPFRHGGRGPVKRTPRGFELGRESQIRSITAGSQGVAPCQEWRCLQPLHGAACIHVSLPEMRALTLSPGQQLLSADLSLAQRVCERAGRSVERDWPY